MLSFVKEHPGSLCDPLGSRAQESRGLQLQGIRQAIRKHSGGWMEGRAENICAPSKLFGSLNWA